jgi:hypothetical protein
MPLWKLQRVGGDVFDFLYAHTIDSHASVELRPGVAYCFRRFHGLVEHLVRGAWVRFVRDLTANRSLLGDTASLDEFLFGAARADLSVYRPILLEVQGHQCFYCTRRLDTTMAVDHFVPWSRYPVDLGHNFVLAHTACNGRKKDRLAAVEHLEHWCVRNDRHGVTLDQAFREASVVADRTTSERVTHWAYEQVEADGGLVWMSDDNLVPLSTRWRSLLATGA